MNKHIELIAYFINFSAIFCQFLENRKDETLLDLINIKKSITFGDKL